MRICKSLIIFLILLSAFQTLLSNNFRQEVNTLINVELNDSLHTLTGHIQIEYINNSSDTLNSIFFHLWPNAFKNNETAFAKQILELRNSDFYFYDDSQRGYIDSLDFRINRSSALLTKCDKHIDIAELTLIKPLLPGDTVVMTSPFFVKLPEIVCRFGHDNESYYITHWFPKPAVYNHNGWNTMPYLYMGEFFQEFGNYIVNITLPDDYIVAATGELISNIELQRLKQYAENRENNFKRDTHSQQQSPKKTITYIAENVIDFAWFASKDFIVKLDTITLGNDGEVVNCWSFYFPENKELWKHSNKYLKRSVRFFSEIIGDYPYSNCIVVDAGRIPLTGMEYPGILLADGLSNFTLDRVIAHEVAHQWFYAILASNERDDPWIDEGFTSYYEQRYIDKFYPNASLSKTIIGEDFNIGNLGALPNHYIRELAWIIIKRENLSQAAGLKSEEFTPYNYFAMLYNKTVAAITSLEKYLGRDVFDDMMKSFYMDYKLSHIYPSDIKEHFESYTQKDLSWFFDGLIYSDKTPGYKIKKVYNDSVIISNDGEIDLPLFLHIGDSLIIDTGFYGEKSYSHDGKSKISIDKNLMSLDHNRSKNYHYPTFSDKLNKYKFNVLNIVDIPGYKQLGALPFVGYNLYDGWMPGAVFYSSFLPKRNFEYQIAPLWGINSSQLSGLYNISYFYHTSGSNRLREIELYSKGQKFSVDLFNKTHYVKAEGGINFRFKHNSSSLRESALNIRNIYASSVWTDSMRNYQHIKYSFNNHRIINPYSFNLNLEGSKNHVKFFSESKYKITYDNTNRGFNIRFFAGTFLYDSGSYNDDYRFRLSGLAGNNDYLYEHLYIARNYPIHRDHPSLWAHQFAKSDGGFAMFTPWGQTNKWMLSLNLSSSLLWKFTEVYYNIATVPDNNDYWSIGNIFYEAGISISLIPEIITVYFPIIASEQIIETSEQFYANNYFQRIRFTLYLEKINPYRIRDSYYYLF